MMRRATYATVLGVGRRDEEDAGLHLEPADHMVAVAGRVRHDQVKSTIAVHVRRSC